MKISSLITLVALTSMSLSAVAGEFGNRCTTGLTKGVVVNSDCSINEMFKGNTLCFGNAEAKQVFFDSKDKQQFVDKAAAFYPKVLNGSVK
jgi:hypothetical protein